MNTDFRTDIENRIAAAETELAALRSTLAFADEEPEAPEPYFECEDYEHDTTCVSRAPYADRPSACVSVNSMEGYVPHSRIPELVKTLAELYISDVPDKDPRTEPSDFDVWDRHSDRAVGVAASSPHPNTVYVHIGANGRRNGVFVPAADIPAMITAMLRALPYAPKE